MVVYHGISLTPTCMINYVHIRHNYGITQLFNVNMQLDYGDMQHIYANMRNSYMLLMRFNSVVFQHNHIAC